MLIPYQRDYEKIAMGLLSYMPNEKKVKKLQHTIAQYASDSNWQLYLWKEDAFIGVIGIEEAEDTTYLQHLCVNPSYRDEGVAKRMVQAVEKQNGIILCATKSTGAFLESCNKESS